MRANADPAWVMVYDATDVNGDEVSPVIEAHAVTAVIVFASWCEECQHEIGVLAALVEADPRVGVIALNAMEEQGGKGDDGRMRAYVKDHAAWLRVVKADDAVLAAMGGVTEIPSLFLFDADGKRIATYQHTERKPPELQELQDTVSNSLLPPAPATTTQPAAATQPAATQP